MEVRDLNARYVRENFAEVIDKVNKGEVFAVSKNGLPKAYLIPLTQFEIIQKKKKQKNANTVLKKTFGIWKDRTPELARQLRNQSSTRFPNL